MWNRLDSVRNYRVYNTGMRNEAPWTRARLAALAGVNLETVRYYEQQKLLPVPERTPAGYRLYRQEHLMRLKFIRKAQSLGFTLNEIRELLLLRSQTRKSSKRVKDLAEHKIADIEHKIRDLQRMQIALQHISSSCDGKGTTDSCPILMALDDNESPAPIKKGQCHESH